MEKDDSHRRRQKKEKKKGVEIFNPNLYLQYSALFYRYDKGKVTSKNKEVKK